MFRYGLSEDFLSKGQNPNFQVAKSFNKIVFFYVQNLNIDYSVDKPAFDDQLEHLIGSKEITQ